MAGGVRSILIRFLGDSSGLRRATGEAEGGFKSFSKHLDDIGRKVGAAEGLGGKAKAAWGGLGDMLSTTGGKAAVASAGVGALVVVAGKAVTEFEDSTLAVGKFRDATGTTSEEASRFVEVFNDLGIGAEAGQVAMGRFAKTLGTDATAFDQFGVSVVRAKDGTIDMAATFVNAVGALNAIQDPAQRAAAGAAMFGRGWQSMAEMVGMGADKVRAALDGVDASKVFSDADIQSGRDLRDAMDRIADAGEALSLTLGKSLAPVVADLAPIFASAVEKLQPIVEQVGKIARAVELASNPWAAYRAAVGAVVKELDYTQPLDDFRAKIDRLRMSAEDVAEQLKIYADENVGSADATRALADAANISTVAAQQYSDGLDQVADATRNLGDDQQRLADQVRKSNDAAVASKWDAYSRSLDAVEKAHQAAEYEARRQADAEAELARQMEDAKRAADELFSAERARFDVGYRLTEATNEAAAAVDEYGTLANSKAPDFLALAAAQKGVEQAALAQADAVLAAAQNQADLNGTTLDGAQKQAIFRQALIDFANSLPDLSPLKGRILDMAAAMDAIDESKEITVTADTSDADAKLADVRGPGGIGGAGMEIIAKQVKVDGDNTAALAAIADAQSAADALAAKTYAAKVVVTGDAAAIAQLRAVAAEAQRMQSAVGAAMSSATASANRARDAMLAARQYAVTTL